MNEALILTALSEYAVSEQQGSLHEERIMQYAQETGIPYYQDETPWCSLFMNWVAMKCGADRTGALLAREWAKVGEEVTTPEMGDIVVFWRGSPNGWQGHVALFVGYSKDRTKVYVLGGNQSNQVNVSAYSSDRIITFRRL